MSKAKFIVARELIKEENYEAARAVLVTIDHPLAADWLAKLDRLAPSVDSTGESVPASTETDVFTELPTVDELTASAPAPAEVPAVTKPAAPPGSAAAVKPAAPPSPPAPRASEPDDLDLGTPPDAEVAPVAPHPIPAPASHAAFRRPEAQGAVAAPEMSEPAAQKNVAPKSGAAAARSSGQKASARRSMSAAAKATRVPDAQPGVPPATSAASQPPTWKAWVSWLLLGTPAPNETNQLKRAQGAPVDDRTPSDDEAVDWRDLPSHAAGARVDEMPWLSGKLDNRASFRPVATLSNAALSRQSSAESLEWEFASELPTAPEPDLDILTHVIGAEATGPRTGRRFFDALNLIVIGLLLCGLFAFLVMSRQAASTVSETYSIGIFDLMVLGSGVLLVILGIWRMVRPSQRAS